MTHEQRTINVTAYRDADGHPTCCADWNSARCIFVQTRKLGLIEVCALSGKDIPRQPADLRRGEFVTDPSEHLLRPVKGCIVWAHEIEEAQG